MSKFVVHKKGFYYTDEAFVSEGAIGSIVGSFDTLEAAQKAKVDADVESLQNLGGENAVDFFFYSGDYDTVYQQLEDYYKTEFQKTIEDKYYFNLPGEISEPQAKKLLEILSVTFHDIVEYSEEPDPDDFVLDEELGEF